MSWKDRLLDAFKKGMNGLHVANMVAETAKAIVIKYLLATNAILLMVIILDACTD